MKFSVITVCKNAKDTIEKTFQSVFSQTYPDFELIVIDGVSNDGTLDVIEKYKDKISYLISESDTGIYNAMNKGIEAANGDFLIFLNANDSFYDESVLKNVAQKIAQNPVAKLFFGDANYVPQDGEPFVKSYADIGDLEKFFLRECICHQVLFYKKELFEKFGKYDEAYKIAADYDFNIKCMLQNKVPFVYLDFVVSNFALGGACSSKETAKLQKAERRVLMKKFFKRHLLRYDLDELFKKMFGSLYRKMGSPFGF